MGTLFLNVLWTIKKKKTLDVQKFYEQFFFFANI